MDEADEIDYASGIQAFESKHFSRAIQLLSPLAIKGIADAQHRCAIMFQNGLGVAANPEAAYQWMSAAAEQGHAVAQHGLGFMYMEGDCAEKNGELAVHWFTKAAHQGLAGSQTTLAMMYEQGKRMVQKSRLLNRHRESDIASLCGLHIYSLRTL